MGNRILKESILTSRKIEALTPFEETFFYRLIVSADDYGIYYADPLLLGHMLFPLRKTLTPKVVKTTLDRLEQLHLITRYTVGGEAFLKLVSWEKHQRLRNSRRKFPAPEGTRPKEVSGTALPEAGAPEAGTPEAGAAEAAAPEAHVPDADLAEASAPETDVPEAGATEAGAPDAGAPEADPDSPVVVTLSLNDGTEYPVTQRDAEKYAALYPAVDIDRELRLMQSWCVINREKRKTRSAIQRFIHGWMGRAQDQSGASGTHPDRPSYPPNPYLNPALACEGIVV